MSRGEEQTVKETLFPLFFRWEAASEGSKALLVLKEERWRPSESLYSCPSKELFLSVIRLDRKQSKSGDLWMWSPIWLLSLCCGT